MIERTALEKYNSLDQARSLIVRELQTYEAEFKCFSCDHFDKKDGFCTQWNATPPIEGLMAGCEKWDHIPF